MPDLGTVLIGVAILIVVVGVIVIGARWTRGAPPPRRTSSGELPRGAYSDRFPLPPGPKPGTASDEEPRRAGPSADWRRDYGGAAPPPPAPRPPASRPGLRLPWRLPELGPKRRGPKGQRSEPPAPLPAPPARPAPAPRADEGAVAPSSAPPRHGASAAPHLPAPSPPEPPEWPRGPEPFAERPAAEAPPPKDEAPAAPAFDFPEGVGVDPDLEYATEVVADEPESAEFDDAEPAPVGIDTGGGYEVADAADGPAAAAAVSEPGPEEPKRVVNTGLATLERPENPLGPDEALGVGGEYLFWLEIGAPVSGSIETKPTGVSEELARQEAHLTVLLFDVGGSQVVIVGTDRGELRLRPDGSAVVEVQPTDDLPRSTAAGLLGRRLFFPLRSPTAPGVIQFRCNLYHAGVLIQSRLVRCDVQPRAGISKASLSSTLDYVLARNLTPSNLSAAAPHQLSIMTNENERGTHGFYFASGDGRWAKGAEFDGHELQALVAQARGSLRLAAWGQETEWNHEPYRYDGAADRQRLTGDLVRICNRGYSFYSALIDRLAGLDMDADSRADALRTLMRHPGSVQIALHANPRFVLPAALIYDYDLDTGLSVERYRLCGQFVADLDARNELATSACFTGECPNRTGHYDVVCPSGLWGYRHAIGLPVSLDGEAEWAEGGPRPSGPEDDDDPPGEIDIGDALDLAVGVSTDPDLKLWADHAVALQAIRAGIGWHLADQRDSTFELLASLAPDIVYFYCHGGISNGRPFIQVGPKNDEVIFSDNLRARHIRWKAPRPLVFINGCHTTAVEPEVAHELVSGFVTIARAAGVIGTEITIFEPLASAFAESFFRAFLSGASVGDAVRSARLELLQRGNPLGLAYTAYALSNLRMVGLPN